MTPNGQPTEAAASSSATEQAVPTLESMSAADRATFFDTGELPQRQAEGKDNQAAEAATTGDSATSKTEGEDSPASAAASEAANGKETEGKGGRAEQRIKELLADIKSRDAELEKLRPKPETKREAAEKVVAAVPRPKMDDANADGTPKYATLEDFADALTDWKFDQRFSEQQEKQEKASREAKAAETRQQQEQTFYKRIEAAKGKHKDFEAIAFDKSLQIPPNTVLDRWILERESGADVLYALGKDRAKLAEIIAMQPVDQAAALRDLEVSLSGTASPNKKDPPVRVIKSAPEVNAQDSPPEDEEADAVKKGDFAKFERLMNKKEEAAGRRL